MSRIWICAKAVATRSTYEKTCVVKGHAATVLLWLGLALGALSIPAMSIHVPLLENEGAYFCVDQEMARGARLYTDIWDHKPPLLYLQARSIQRFTGAEP